MKIASRPESGLTLVEMLAVLFILALVAGIAVTATEVVMDRSKYDVTIRQLEELRVAIAGNPSHRNADGSAAISGFVADMGRLPNIFVDPDAGLLPDPDFAKRGPRLLKELWEKGTLPDYSVTELSTSTLDGIGGIFVGAGWRGPYLHAQAGGILDGWGLYLRAYPASGTATSAYDPSSFDGLPAGFVRSWGANRLFDAATAPGFDADLETILHRTVPPTRLHEGSLTVNVSVVRLATPGFVTLRLYGPNPNGQPGMLSPSSGSDSYIAAVPAGPADVRVSMSFPISNQTIGPRVLCAYRTDADPMDHQYLFPPGTSRALMNLTMIPGLNTVTVTIP